jgi:hypothetical protein
VVALVPPLFLCVGCGDDEEEPTYATTQKRRTVKTNFWETGKDKKRDKSKNVTANNN